MSLCYADRSGLWDAYAWYLPAGVDRRLRYSAIFKAIPSTSVSMLPLELQQPLQGLKSC